LRRTARPKYKKSAASRGFCIDGAKVTILKLGHEQTGSDLKNLFTWIDRHVNQAARRRSLRTTFPSLKTLFAKQGLAAAAVRPCESGQYAPIQRRAETAART
jgi:hypothetical protein